MHCTPGIVACAAHLALLHACMHTWHCCMHCTPGIVACMFMHIHCTSQSCSNSSSNSIHMQAYTFTAHLALLHACTAHLALLHARSCTFIAPRSHACTFIAATVAAATSAVAPARTAAASLVALQMMALNMSIDTRDPDSLDSQLAYATEGTFLMHGCRAYNFDAMLRCYCFWLQF